MRLLYFYEGYACPICQQAFTENDDIVACPQCGLPHHRACWAKEGHCHLYHLHNTDEQWSRDKASAARKDAPSAREAVKENLPYQICSRCHTQNPEFAEFCKHCGSPLKNENDWQSNVQQNTPYSEYQPFRNTSYSSQNVDPDEVIDEVSAEDLSAYVGTKADYYLPRFRRMARGGSSASWNWAAFFFGPLWLLYRKMYGLGAIVMIFEIIQTAVMEISYKALGFVMTEEMTYAEVYALVESALSNPSNLYFLLSISLLSVIMLVISIVIAVFGNRLYRDHCQRTIKRAREKTPDLTSGELSSIGGVSIAVTVIGYIAQYFITQILVIFI